jgi:hypothetical protein
MKALGCSANRVWRRGMGRIIACLVMATVVAGCTTARSDLGTSVSACYLALPTATKAVDGHGHLLGVQEFTIGSLQRRAPNLYGELATHPSMDKRICVVAFGGTFDKSSVTEGRGRENGHLAVVVSTSPGNHLLGTVILARPPLRFGHPHVG